MLIDRALSDTDARVRANAILPGPFSSNPRSLTAVGDALYLNLSASYDVTDQVQVFGARDYAMRVWIDPARAASDLSKAEVRRLLAGIRTALGRAEGKRYRAGAGRFAVYGRQGEPCGRCRTPIARITGRAGSSLRASSACTSSIAPCCSIAENRRSQRS